MSFKRATVVMLPTKEKANECPILYFPKTGRLNKRGYSDEELQAGNGLIKLDYTTNHLYITSDDEIKEGDWCIDINKSIYQHKENKSFTSYFQGKKIIATTDSSLSPRLHIDEVIDNSYPKEFRDSILPQPSQSFIKKYVEEYNKGNVITEVMIEYDVRYRHHYKTGEVMVSLTKIPDFNSRNMQCIKVERNETLKVNPKDNTITIKKVKDTWTTDELLGNGETSLDTYLLNSESITQEERELIMKTLCDWIEEKL